MHKLPVGGDIMGGLFTLAIVLKVLDGVPLAPLFLLGIAVPGAIMNIIVMHWHRRQKIEIDDLSALGESTNKTPKAQSISAPLQCAGRGQTAPNREQLTQTEPSLLS